MKGIELSPSNIVWPVHTDNDEMLPSMEGLAKRFYTLKYSIIVFDDNILHVEKCNTGLRLICDAKISIQKLALSCATESTLEINRTFFLDLFMKVCSYYFTS